MTGVRILVAAAGLAIVLNSGAAHADAIDGDWCTADGRLHLTIQGQRIVTPGGRAMEGDYTRHSFIYQSPSAEPDAGQTIYMVLLNEESMRSRAGARPSGEPGDRLWNCCKRPIS